MKRDKARVAWRVLAGAITLAVLLVGCNQATESAPAAAAASAAESDAKAEHVGSTACASCHAAQHAAWQTSHHAQAMKAAAPGAVLGSFNNTRFVAGGITTIFAQRDGRYVVQTQDTPQGPSRTYEVSHVLGITPLQQLLLDVGNGRLQAFDVAWDSRPHEQGGQRWFHLQGAQPPKASDELHWRGHALNANLNCIECHSTGFEKRFNAASTRYASRWAEMGVGCEACHGAGSAHVTWATAGLRPGATQPSHKGFTSAANTGPELELCARCHAHRASLTDPPSVRAPLMNSHVLTLLEEGLFWRDGQMRGEAFNHASFLQSRMHAKGVSCGHCHEPHSQRLRAVGDALCASCHERARFETPAHHHHASESKGARCVSCHMPVATAMRIDARHDHSFRVPRPDLSARHGTPNACANCHRDKTVAWTAQWATRWYPQLGKRGTPWPEATLSLDRGEPQAQQRLLDLITDPQQNAVTRASALRRLPAELDQRALQQLAHALRDSDPLLRHAAVDALASAAPHTRAALLAPMLDDPLKAVRTSAARWLAALPPQTLAPPQAERLQAVLAEYIAIQQHNADRPEAHDNLGTLYADQGRWPEAEAAFQQALKLDAQRAASALNLADVYRATGREEQAQALLRGVLQREPRNALAHFTLGLTLQRQQRRTEALAALQQAWKLAPRQPRHAEVYALALEGAGRTREAVRLLQGTAAAHPHRAQTRQWLQAMCQRSSACEAAP